MKQHLVRLIPLIPLIRLIRLLAWVGAAALLGVVFMAYLNPHTVVDLANRVWACF